jgi:pyruvate dehydrogenase E2 component (dihydrolipoamide acetyltransferase)
MPIEIVMPRMGLTMEEGTVTAWLKQAGQTVRAGEPLLEIETDKTTVEIESPGNGVLAEGLTPVGVSVPVGTVIGHLLEAGENAPPTATPAVSTPPARVRASPAARHRARQLGLDLAQITGTGPGGRVVAWNVQTVTAAPVAAPRVSPVAQRVAADLGVNLAEVAGTGPSGRVTRKDVEEAAVAPSPTATALATEAIQPLTRAQRLTADRMVASFTSAPHFYLHAEVDARPLVTLRASLLPRLEERAKVHLTYTDLLVKWCALTLAQHRGMMAQWTDTGLRQAAGVHLGLAVDTPHGLVVPVLHDADRLSLTEIARGRADLAERARTGKLLPQDLELGVFTLTNLGMYKVDAFQAILNPPQAAILAIGRLKERPLADHGALIAAPTLMLSLSVDHRVVDGAAGARFLTDLVDMLELPGLALA